MIKYFLMKLGIYILLLGGLSFSYVDNSIESLRDKEVGSNVKFVYEAF